MKKKRIAALLLTAAVGFGSITADGGAGMPFGGIAGAKEITVQAASSPSAKTLAKAVKKAYGDDYLPQFELDKDTIKSRYGVSSSWYSSAYAEVPMISAQVDELVIFKAKNSASQKKILSAVKKYQKELKESTMQYPMNVLKIQGSKIYKNGNYVCFIMLGVVGNSVEENGTDEEIIKAHQKQNLKAVKAIKKKLK